MADGSRSAASPPQERELMLVAGLRAIADVWHDGEADGAAQCASCRDRFGRFLDAALGASRDGGASPPQREQIENVIAHYFDSHGVGADASARVLSERIVALLGRATGEKGREP